MNLKKPNFWDYKRPNILAYILFPIAFLIQKLKIFKTKTYSNNFKIKTICVGNIYIGGTGKTSLCIKLNKIFKKKQIKSCYVKKFYKNQIDEQSLLKNNGKLFLSSSRIQAIREAESENFDIAILDDGLQDTSIKCDVNLLCFNNINWIGNGMTLPAGPLRENIKNLKKYNHVFLNGNLENLDNLKKEIYKINSNINIHVGKYELINLNEFNKTDQYFVFSGIGNHETFVSMIQNSGLSIKKDIEFPDHYKYKNKDISKILEDAKNSNCKVITTEKDYLRLSDNYSDQINFIKAELQILDEENFIKSII